MGTQWLLSGEVLSSEANVGFDEASYCLESFNILGHLKSNIRYIYPIANVWNILFKIQLLSG